MPILNYVTGDVTKALPFMREALVIVQVVNDLNVYGAGVSGAISRRWPVVEKDYRSTAPHELGYTSIINVDINVYVANMVAQHGIQRPPVANPDNPPIRYLALRDCMDFVRDFCLEEDAEIAGPRFGSGLAGGDWNQIEIMIRDIWVAEGIPVTIYDL